VGGALADQAVGAASISTSAAASTKVASQRLSHAVTRYTTIVSNLAAAALPSATATATGPTVTKMAIQVANWSGHLGIETEYGYTLQVAADSAVATVTAQSVYGAMCVLKHSDNPSLCASCARCLQAAWWGVGQAFWPQSECILLGAHFAETPVLSTIHSPLHPCFS
jgi:hypothetical protein